ncbi:SRPBCC family protein [Streptomyces griseoincarnatus]|uniref:SRPBCC family protein n=1 Tax=unclassified Streptomyces TaxID=2593676 RepID=UPI0015E8138F|nr:MULTISPECIES: SRPBCC family protein [unclassified Streptomyces]MBJ6647801.1 SRPBCC family protein [Streptomyces sp. BSE7-9]MCA2204894.1 SRPBCC family protein [Streptomyces sp. SMS_SU21]
MAVRHRLIRTDPRTVWSVLEDGTRYADWVVGTSESKPVRGHWPQLGSAIRYEVPVGPLKLHNETVVRRCIPGEVLELEAKAGPLGTARIAIEVQPWGDWCLVKVDEHPLRGAGGFLHNVAVEALIQFRHRAMLARLAHLVETEAAEAEERRPLGQIVPPEPDAGGARG